MQYYPRRREMLDAIHAACVVLDEMYRFEKLYILSSFDSHMYMTNDRSTKAPVSFDSKYIMISSMPGD